MAPTTFAERMRAFGWFLFSVLFYLVAREVAVRAARGLAPGDWFELVDRAILLFLLLLGFAVFGMVGQGQQSPLRQMGLGARPGWRGEFALGAALGWAGIVACVLPVALFGGLTISFAHSAHQVVLLVGDFLLLAVAALLEEVGFRGYPYQRLIDAMGPVAATLFMSAIFAAAHLQNPGASAASLISTLLAGWLLSLAYLRTRALWLSWGFHFSWNASMGLLFGLPVSGLTIFSPVVSTYTRGPVSLTGGGYGPEGSATAIVVLLVLLVVLVRVTRDLKHRYAGPVIVAAGIPVDIDALAKRQHEQALGPNPQIAPASQQLVQILAPAPPSPLPARPPVDEDPDRL